MGRIITLSMAVLMTIGGTGVVLSEFDLLSDTMMGDPNNPNYFIPDHNVASQNGLSLNPDITTNPFAADLLQPTILDQSQLIARVAR
jgi:hypothetical protein